MKIIDVSVDQIDIGERRTDYGNIGALAAGMRRVGLIEPIVVDHNGNPDCYRLVAGGRRLKAAQMLQWKTIPAQLREQLSDAELRDIEFRGKRESQGPDGTGAAANIRIQQEAGRKREANERGFVSQRDRTFRSQRRPPQET